MCFDDMDDPRWTVGCDTCPFMFGRAVYLHAADVRFGSYQGKWSSVVKDF